MKKILSTNYSTGAFNVGTLILRLVLGVLMLVIGFEKLSNFDKHLPDMYNFLDLGKKTSLILVIFAEFFCSAILIIGLLTRLACIPLIIVMGVALFIIHKGQFFGDGQTAALFLAGYVVLLLIGPGKISVDGLVGK